jgi:hypothetical protein
MDPVSLASAAVLFVTPYLVEIGKEVTKSVADEAGKSVWTWIKGKLTSPAGAETVADSEADPKNPVNAQALQAALTKFLTRDPESAIALAELLQKHGASCSTQTANVAGDYNKVGQASSGSSVTIS